MRLKLKISLADKRGQGFMGVGLVWLLRRIEKYRSINRAAADMEMSYAKALKILNRLEEKLGRKVLRRKKGGVQRGGTDLTAYGKYFLAAYERFQDKIQTSGRDHFETFKAELEKRTAPPPGQADES